MIVKAILTAVKYLVIAVISLLPTIPKLDLSYLDGVFMLLSLVDLFISVGVLAGCLLVLFVFLHLELVWSVIMWCVRKIPGVN